MDMLWYGHKNGFVPEAEFDFLWNNCTSRAPSAHTLGKWGVGTSTDDLLRIKHKNNAAPSPECVLAERKFLLSSSKGFSQVWEHAWINDLTLYGPVRWLLRAVKRT